MFIGYDILSVEKEAEPVNLSIEEINQLAAFEHTRWLLHKKNRGWNYGVGIDRKSKEDPQLISYDLLNEDQKKKICEFVKRWPKILAHMNFKLKNTKGYRL
ncbi:RyR domain-containing protein [Alkalibacter mobilis]|uniref:RyR domain-containing protein n=1 Tax=Alkalibacter mobilis TaxID=2787712 RepID=UPI00189CAE6B|nr:RyR domain-containing protein [Alkalibacter mobilis]